MLTRRYDHEESMRRNRVAINSEGLWRRPALFWRAYAYKSQIGNWPEAILASIRSEIDIRRWRRKYPTRR